MFGLFKKKVKEEMSQIELDIIEFSENFINSDPSKIGILDFSLDSLKVVDNMLEEGHQHLDEIDEDFINDISNSVGSYIFRVLKEKVGGKYYYYDRLNQPILVVGQPEFEISILTVEKVKGRIKNGMEDNIPFFVEGFLNDVGNAKKGENKMHM